MCFPDGSLTRWYRTLRLLNLPASLEALERPVGLPPSLLKKGEEVRMEKGPIRIGTSIEDVQKLARYNTRLLDEVRSLLQHLCFSFCRSTTVVLA